MKQLKRMAFVVLSALPAQASVLSDAASALPEGTFVKLPANASLTGLNMGNPLLYWNDSAVWNPVANRLQWVGAGGTCCSNGQFYLMTYTAASDQWAISPAPFSGSGHAYDGNAVDPATGLHYFGRYYDAQVHTWNGSTWGTLPNQPWTSTTPSLSFFPDLNGGKGGLIFMGESPRVAWYDGAKWTAVTGGQWGSYNNFSEYNPVHKVVWLGAGNGGDRVHNKLDAALKITRLKDAPFSLNNSQALHSCDPVSGMFIVTNLNNNAWWAFDIVSDTWTELTNLANAPTLNASEMHAPIPEYGVILYFKHANSTREVYLYRHSASSGTAARRPGAPAEEPGIRISPNPFRGFTSIRIEGGQAAQMEIIDVGGKSVGSFAPASLIHWRAGTRAPGVYLLRATVGKRVMRGKLLLSR